MQGAPEGLCVVASEQTAGRGRLERQWVSPKNAGLYFSIVLRPTLEQRSLPLITLMASLAVRDALADACKLQTDIKWPNDVLANGRKLCGILAEMIDTSIGRAVIAGIGINLTRNSFPADLQATATSVEDVTGKPPNVDDVLDSLLSALAKRYEVLQSLGGATKTVAEWSNASSFAQGKAIRIVNGGEVLEGITRGLEPDGALRLELAEGEIRIVRSGDVTMQKSGTAHGFTHG